MKYVCMYGSIYLSIIQLNNKSKQSDQKIGTGTQQNFFSKEGIQIVNR